MLANLDSSRSISLLALGTGSVLSQTALQCSFGGGVCSSVLRNFVIVHFRIRRGVE